MNDKKLYRYLIYVLILYYTLDLGKAVLNFERFSLVNYFLEAVMLILILICSLKVNPGRSLIITILFIVVWLISIILNQETMSIFKFRGIRFWLYSYPAILCILNIYDLSVLRNKLESFFCKLEYLGIVIFILLFIIRNEAEYSGALSNLLAVETVFLIDKYSQKKELKNIILVLINIVIILSVGQRNSLLVIVLYVCFRLFRYIIKNKKYYYFIYAVLGIGIISNYYIYFLTKLDLILDNLNISSRFIKLILNNEALTYMSGRNLIYSNLINGIKDNLFWGYGVCGDATVAIKNGFFVEYSHSIILEILLSFGMIFGMLVLLLIMFFCVKTLFERDSNVVELKLICMSIAIGTLLFNSSFWVSIEFWIFIVISIRTMNRRKTWVK